MCVFMVAWIGMYASNYINMSLRVAGMLISTYAKFGMLCKFACTFFYVGTNIHMYISPTMCSHIHMYVCMRCSCCICKYEYVQLPTLKNSVTLFQK